MKIAIINTGGTISCVGDPLAPMTADDFAKASKQLLDPILRQQFPELQIDYLTSVSFPESQSHTLDSTNLQPSDWCIMAKAILDHYMAYAGFVVLHGTDTMDFTGTALPFLLNSTDANGYGTAVLSKPVIITGSQMPMYHQDAATKALSLNFNTDAYQNVCGAVAAACSGIPEVGIYFQDRLYRGSRAVKTNASEFNAFSSPNYPALAEYGVELTLRTSHWLPGPVHDRVSLDTPSVLTAQKAALSSISARIDQCPVIQLSAYPSAYSMSPAKAFIAEQIKAAVAAGARGIVLESYGEGNFPSGNPDKPALGAIYQALHAANDSGVHLVDCTQVLAGTVNSNAYAAGAWLPQVGALAPADMTPMAALVKLMVLMASGWSRDQIRFLFQTDMLGEMAAVNSLDSRLNATLPAGQSLTTLDASATLTNDTTLGPVLWGANTKTADQPIKLWSLPKAPTAQDLPGRLVMQDDGNLVFYSRNNQPLWASNTGRPQGASSRLTLTGTFDSERRPASTVVLQVYDYSDMKVASVIYRSSS